MMLLLLFVLGLCVGSFLNVLAERLPKGEDVIKGRSHCDYCKHTLRWYELIPLLSFVIQKGKSRCCHKQLSFQYPLIELLTGVGFVVLSFFYEPLTMNYLLFSYLFSLIVLSSFIVIFISDFKYEIIPIEMIITGFLSALCIVVLSPLSFGYLRDCFSRRDVGIAMTQCAGTVLSSPLFLNHVLSGVVAGAFFFCLWFFTKGRAMGDGDMFLAFLIGLTSGFPKIIVSLYAAFLTGAVAGVILILQRKKGLKSHIPFGPFLIIGLVIALLFGDTIIMHWRSLW